MTTLMARAFAERRSVLKRPASMRTFSTRSKAGRGGKTAIREEWLQAAPCHWSKVVRASG
jgi:hypothetical protein